MTTPLKTTPEQAQHQPGWLLIQPGGHVDTFHEHSEHPNSAWHTEADAWRGFARMIRRSRKTLKAAGWSVRRGSGVELITQPYITERVSA